MERDDFKHQAGTSRFIPGIYNYCDRWCERCPMTSRCRLFSDLQSGRYRLSTEERDVENEAFWDRMGDKFDETVQKIHEAAARRKFDIDWDDLELDDEELDAYQEKEERIREKVERHSAACTALAYSDCLAEWFEAGEDSFEARRRELVQQAEMGLDADKLVQEAEDLKDALEVLRWYEHQIYVKIARALHGLYDDFVQEDFVDDPIQTDANGSAKVALIGIQRSMAALGNLLLVFEEHEDRILDLLVLLEHAKRLVEETFPDARAFRRPGFDTA